LGAAGGGRSVFLNLRFAARLYRLFSMPLQVLGLRSSVPPPPPRLIRNGLRAIIISKPQTVTCLKEGSETGR
jgi:hypothetical protein